MVNRVQNFVDLYGPYIASLFNELSVAPTPSSDESETLLYMPFLKYVNVFTLKPVSSEFSPIDDFARIPCMHLNPVTSTGCSGTKTDLSLIMVALNYERVIYSFNVPLPIRRFPQRFVENHEHPLRATPPYTRDHMNSLVGIKKIPQ